ncbi:MAG: TolC family protein [Deltaproteobacteria bacterium]|jgi:outer membrane protein|nr:TolC family protein [Deltaproteobacteria bacterium]
MKKMKLVNILWITFLVVPALFQVAYCTEQTAPQNPKVTDVHITLQKMVHESVVRNSSAMNDYLQAKMSKEQVVAEGGVFDTVFQALLQAKSTHMQNGAEDAVNRRANEYSDRTDSLEVGVSGLYQLGTLWDFKFNQNKRSSSTIDQYTSYDHEYDNSLKLTLTQPLLKGFGSKSTMAKINIAELQSTIDADKFEQKLMELVGVTVQVYWKLYGAQQLFNSWEKSVIIAEEAIKDLELRVRAGKIAQTEYLENVSAVSIRKSEFYNAKSKVNEAQNQLLTLLNISFADIKNVQLQAIDNPFEDCGMLQDAESYVSASLSKWPEYKVARKKLEKEKVQLGFLENQSLPQLDILGSFGTTSLDRAYGDSFLNVTDGGYLNWTVGLKFVFPFANSQATSNLKIAKMRTKQAEIELDAFVKSYGNSIHSKLSEAGNYQSQLRDLESGLRIKTDLLEIERQKLKAGRTSLKTVLDKQDEYISYQRRVLSGVVNYKLAEASLDIAAGKILSKYGVDPQTLNYSDEVLSGRMGTLFGERIK